MSLSSSIFQSYNTLNRIEIKCMANVVVILEIPITVR
jgi:hypothetical protein